MFRTTLAALLIALVTSSATAQEPTESKLERKEKYQGQFLYDGENDGKIELLIRDLKKLAHEQHKTTGEIVKVRLLAQRKYWVGLQCEDVDPALLSQLKLPASRGIVVRKVVDKTPAAKAGIEVHDLLLKAGDVELNAVTNLIEAVQQAGTKALKFELIRKGQTLTIEVTPAARAQEVPVKLEPGSTIRHWLIEEPQLPGHTLKFRSFGPAIVIDGSPKGLRIGITKTDNGPSKITVNRDGKAWTLTDKNLDKLPEDIRKTVREYLKNIEAVRPHKGAHGAIRIEYHDISDRNAADYRHLDRFHAIQLPRAVAKDDTVKRLQNIEKKLDQLQKSIDALVKQKN